MSFVKNLIGGAVIMVVATAIGIAHNAVRGKPVKLIARMAGPTPVASQQNATADPPASNPSANPGESAPAAASDAGAPEITMEEFTAGEVTKERVRTIIQHGTATIIDARAADEFAEGHILGAMNVPYDKFMDYVNDVVDLIPMDSPVIIYCRSITCDFSDQVANELRLMGYEKVVLYRGGWDEWSEAGFPSDEGSE